MVGVLNNFNPIAPVYDHLARAIFGRIIQRSQIHFFSTIKSTDTVLILGGGTGKLLELLPQCERVHFMDLSDKMLNRAKNRNCKTNVTFTKADFLKHDFESTYDVIICPFFLDCFDERNLKNVILKCGSLLKDEGRLIVTDFDNDLTHPVLLKLMNLFFKVMVNLESSRLLNIQETISGLGFIQIQTKSFKKGIFTTIYKKVC